MLSDVYRLSWEHLLHFVTFLTDFESFRDITLKRLREDYGQEFSQAVVELFTKIQNCQQQRVMIVLGLDDICEKLCPASAEKKTGCGEEAGKPEGARMTTEFYGLSLDVPYASQQIVGAVMKHYYNFS